MSARARLLGAWHWAILLTKERCCFVCGRYYLLHTPWRLYRCNRTPLPIEITEKGWALEGKGEQVA
jgi:hypothetical protein